MLSTSRVASVTVTPEGIFMTAESLQRSSCERRLHIEMSRRKSMSAAWMRSAFAPTAELAVSLKKICSFERKNGLYVGTLSLHRPEGASTFSRPGRR